MNNQAQIINLSDHRALEQDDEPQVVECDCGCSDFFRLSNGDTVCQDCSEVV